MEREWKQRIQGCFGNQDQLFAIHPLDERRAFDLLMLLRAEGVGWSAVEPEFREHLEHQGCGPEHVKEQMSRIRLSEALASAVTYAAARLIGASKTDAGAQIREVTSLHRARMRLSVPFRHAAKDDGMSTPPSADTLEIP
jgi:hypothetical protein